MTKFTTGLAFAAGSLAALGCPVINQNHCALTATPCGAGMMCSNCASENNGCVSADTPLGDGCLFDSQTSNPGPTTDIPPTTSSSSLTETTDNTESTVDTFETTVGPTTEPSTVTTTGDTTATSTTETTAAGPCMGEEVGNPQCGGTEPYCIDGECIGCTNPALDCGDVEENKPACEENSGLCVECQVNGDCVGNPDKPACNLETATCGPCDAHEQCPATACNLETGQCFPKDSVLYVDNTSEPPNECSNDKNDGKSPEAPLCTLQAALQKVVEGVPMTIKVKKGTKAQNLSTTVPVGDMTVAIVHYGAQVPSLSSSLAGFPVLAVSAGNTVFMNRIQIVNTMMALSDPGIACNEAVLWMDRQLIFNTRTAVRTNNCRFHLRQSTVTGNVSGGLDLNGSDATLSRVWIENSFITENLGGKFGALKLGGATNVEILYSTIALNSSPLPQIECLNWTGLLEVRNSAIIHPDPQHYGADCGNRTIVSSWDSFEGDEAALKPLFASIDDGVYIARTGGPLQDVAVWRTGDPRLDFDTTPRPTVDCTPDYAGAERPSGVDPAEPIECP